MRDRITPKKSLGQHFLVDTSYCRRIVRLADVQPADTVLEIGPGTGLLTRRLLEAGARVVAVEIDSDMVTHLEVLRDEHPESRLRVVQADILRADWRELPVPTGCKVVGNLPYNIATGIIQRMMESKHRFQSLTCMLQKEVAQRILAEPSTPDYGYFSVLCRYHFQARAGFDVPPEAFRPPPKVRSHVLQLVPRETPSDPVRWAHLKRLLRRSFSSRRKMLANNLRSGSISAAAVRGWLQSCGCDPRARAEQLSLDQFLCLAEMLQSAQVTNGSETPSHPPGGTG